MNHKIEHVRAELAYLRAKSPVVHVDRPDWKLDPGTEKEWDRAQEIERRIEKLAKKFGGTFVGT